LRLIFTQQVLGFLLGLVLCFSSLFFSDGLAAGTTPAMDAHVARAVMIVMEIGEFDLQRNIFSATFWVWNMSDGKKGDDLEFVDLLIG
jgi:hypothetical protein